MTIGTTLSRGLLLLLLGAAASLSACSDGAQISDDGEDSSVPDSGLADSTVDGSGSGADTDSGADGSGEVTPGTVPNGQPCRQDRDCQAGVCIDIPGVSGQSICTVICLSDSDCGSGLDCVPVTTGADAVSACIPVNQCLDGDGDGFGFGAACTGLDCDDADPAVNPRGVEGCDGIDNDCDGLIDDTPIDAGRSCETGFAGRCAQGVTVCSSNALECQPDVLPEDEVCDGIDNDCDGAADEDDVGQPLSRTCYDGPAGTAGVGICAGGRQTCAAGDFGGCLGQTLPAVEICDGVDNDCNGLADDETREVSWYQDADGDGFGSPSASPLSSCVPPAGYVQNADDCDDGERLVNPSAEEQPGDGVDGNCDGTELCFADQDGDGFVSGSAIRSADADCADPGEFDLTALGGDCDDSDPQSYPGAPEIVGNEADNDCDGREICFADADGDGVRSSDEVLSENVVCTDPGEARLTLLAGDCDDRDAAIRPGQLESCNGVDDDCNGAVDDRLPTRRYFVDRDGDGFGTSQIAAIDSCAPVTGYVENDGDCDDSSGDVFPGAVEAAGDGIDQNCDGRELCFADADGDGYRGTGTLLSADGDCVDAGEASAAMPAGDCLDSDRLVRPGVAELPGDGIDQNCDGQESCYADADGDGARTDVLIASPDTLCDALGEASPRAVAGDCDDLNASRRPGATEVCNGVDDNCDGVTDEGLATQSYWRDADGDGYGAAGASPTLSCGPVAGAVSNDGDCDDARATVKPGATETAGDGVDQNCDGQELCYLDADDDGYRPGLVVIVSADIDCLDTGEALAVEPEGDCDDSNPSVRPGTAEGVGDGSDQNCDGQELCYLDADNDGYRPDGGATVVSPDLRCDAPTEAVSSDPAGDCADTDSGRNPGAPELCDGVDNDCNGLTDDNIVTLLYYPDRDGDGRGDASASSVSSCTTVTGSVANAQDCNDNNPTVYTGAAEVAGDGVDQNCDGQELCYLDLDADGFRVDATRLSSRLACDGAGEASASALGPDCDDLDATIYPGGREVAGDGVDSNCDSREQCFVDADGDRYRTTATVFSTRLGCDGAGEAAAGIPAGDCDDTSAARYPGAAEVCDGVDQDCDGVADNGLATQVYYTDSDGDGFGAVSSSGVASCRAVAGTVTNRADCDDADAAVRPGASEVAGDNVDQNCDGSEVCFVDVDGDGYRSGSALVISTDADCSDAGEALATASLGDCDDTRAAVSPSAAEVAGDGVDQNCDTRELCYVDADGDGYRPTGLPTLVSANLSCGDAGEASAAAGSNDCDDTTADRSPGLSERCDGIDNNCNLIVDDAVATLSYYPDRDGDLRGDATAAPIVSCAVVAGRVANASDCNDADASVYSGALEIPGDGVDQSCDGLELCFEDGDGDGYRSSLTGPSSSLSCSQAGFAAASAPSGDCNDLDGAVRPNALEIAGDGVDQNCDGQEICFVNADGDGFRTSLTTVSSSISCSLPGTARALVPAGDCDDASTLRYPGAPEFCDGVDQDCDGVADNGLATLNYYPDADGDGFGRAGSTAVASCRGISGSVTNDGDCDDARSAIRPGVTEVAGDGLDQNCDGQELCYVDADSDGYRNGSTVTVSADADCSDLGEALATAPDTDCNDLVGAIRPGVTEVAGDSVDQNCDGTELCFVDADRDGYRVTGGGTVLSLNLSCADPGEAALATNAGDCADADATRNPGATEICDGVDQDCDGVADDGLATQNYYVDADGDSRGALGSVPVTSCAPVAGRVASSTDCNDGDASVYPGAVEVAGDGVDQNCDDQELCYRNLDGDAYRTDATVLSLSIACSATGLANRSRLNGDCDDLDAAVYPGAFEVAGDGIDQSCDSLELCYVNADNDPYRTNTTVLSPRLACNGSGEAPASRPLGDCDDMNSTRYPGATELCNGVDDDCNLAIDDGVPTQNYYLDADGDTFGAAGSTPVASCSTVAGRVLNASDCNDASAAIRPGVTEIAGDNVDQNCDGAEVCFADADDDGYRPNLTSITISADTDCNDAAEAIAADPAGDCNDANAAVRPNATEIAADGVDQNCDTQELCYADADNDGYRPNATATVVSLNLICTDAGERGASAPTTDCNDLSASIYPGAPEVVADGVDQDCNGVELCYLDNDSDGYRPDATSTLASADLDCADAREARGDFPTTDCNDSNAAINPGVDADADGLNACLDCVDSNNRIPGGVITLTGSTASVEYGNNAIYDLTTQNFRASNAVVARVADVNVRVNLTHTWDGDLVISLVSPSGTVVALSTNNGSSGDNYSTTLFDDEAATAISAGVAPFNGSYRPASPLNAFDTQTMSGNWTLRVADTVGSDSGSMTSWSVDITTACP